MTKSTILFFLTTVVLCGQGVNRGTIDNRNAIATFPHQTGLFAAMPPTCSVGQTYVATDKTPPHYTCTAVNTWTQSSSGSGGSGSAGYSPLFIVASGTPANSTGNNNDMYINSATGDVYGPKASGAWGAIAANIKGPTGATGATGAAGAAGAAGYSPQYIVASGAPASGTGNNGDMYINSATGDVYGPKASGAWGAIAANIKGPTGATGATGATGPAGPAPTTSPNQVLAGPASGSTAAAAAPRALVSADLPATVPAKYFGTAAPGSVSGNLPGDLYSDTNNHVLYECNAPSGTAAPACTSVAAGQWMAFLPGQLTTISVGSIASVPSCSSAAFLYFPNNSYYSPVVGDGTNCHYYVDGMERYPVVPSAWSWSNQNGNSEGSANGTSVLTIFDTGTTVQWSGKVKALPHSAPYTYTEFAYYSLGTDSTMVAGLWLTDGTKQTHIEMLGQGGPGSLPFCYVRVANMASSTDGGSIIYTGPYLPQGACYGATEIGFRIADSGSALTFSYSLDRGASWIQAGSTVSDTSYLTAAYIGYGGTSVSNGAIRSEQILVTSVLFQ